jgi:opacity protein-like surface antigen
MKEMQKLLALSLVGLICGGLAFAQDYPKMETYLGYTFLRANSATDVPAFSTNGGGGQFAYNFNKWIGFVADIGATHNGNIGGVHLDSTFTDYVFGPRVNFRYSRLNPFVHIMWGGMHTGTSSSLQAALNPPPSPSNPIYLPGTGPITNTTPVTLRAVASQTAFAMPLGGGLDIKMTKHVSFRPVELDYFYTRLQNIRSLNDNNQHSLRYMAGINFTFGAQ